MEIKDKIVCVVDRWVTIGRNTHQYPVKGEIYTIRSGRPVALAGITIVALYLKEIVNSIDPDTGNEPWFDSRGFRPVDYKYGQDTITEIEKKLKQKEEVFEKV